MRVSEHLRGPWKAELISNSGHETAIVQDVFAVRVARGEGLNEPVAYPMSALHDDVLYEIREFGDEAEVHARWEQAQAVAEALNERGELDQLRGVVRRVVSITQDTDGDALDIDETVPVGEVLRMLYEFHEDVVERACLGRPASEPGA